MHDISFETLLMLKNILGIKTSDIKIFVRLSIKCNFTTSTSNSDRYII